jgi:hypothetical protein
MHGQALWLRETALGKENPDALMSMNKNCYGAVPRYGQIGSIYSELQLGVDCEICPEDFVMGGPASFNYFHSLGAF